MTQIICKLPSEAKPRMFNCDFDHSFFIGDCRIRFFASVARKYVFARRAAAGTCFVDSVQNNKITINSKLLKKVLTNCTYPSLNENASNDFLGGWVAGLSMAFKKPLHASFFSSFCWHQSACGFWPGSNLITSSPFSEVSATLKIDPGHFWLYSGSSLLPFTHLNLNLFLLVSLSRVYRKPSSSVNANPHLSVCFFIAPLFIVFKKNKQSLQKKKLITKT